MAKLFNGVASVVLVVVAAKPLPHRLEVRSQPNPNQPGCQSFDITLVLMAAEAT